jgi:AraC-like DNA-binding protein
MEQVMLRHISTLFGDLRLLRATYVTQAFPRHFHEDFPLGVIERGALGFYYRGENVIAPEGSINLANPGEAHTGHAVVEAGWTYRMFYFDTEVLQNIMEGITGKSGRLPFFRQGVLNDPELAEQIFRIHLALDGSSVSRLEEEIMILDMLTQLILRHEDDQPALYRAVPDHGAVKRVREYINEHYSENISLERLARIASLSPFHLVRIFRRETGLPPHAYLNQIRINLAKILLSKGKDIADVAFEVGFSDQSHLHKHFRHIVGITPGQYRKNVQDA